MKPRLTWSKQPNESGLALIGQGPRGFNLKVDGVHCGSVRPMMRPAARFNPTGWYFYAHIEPRGGVSINTLVRVDGGSTSWPTVEEAKAACARWVVDHLAKEES